MKKQTSVEWFAEQLGITKGTLLEKAKAMEREQIVNAFKEGLKSPYHQDYALITQEGQEQTKSGQYYNETYGGDNE